MSQQWSRREIEALTRLRRDEPEGQGHDAFLVLRMKITPEAVAALLGGTWTYPDGTVARLDAIHIDDDGFTTPILTKLAAR
jgi:hypothetical protein